MLIIIAGISAYIICVFMTFDHTRSTSILAPTMYVTVYCTFLCVSGLLSIATGIEPVDVKVTVDKSTGSFQISLQGQEWLRSGAVGVRNGGQWWRSSNKDHHLLKQDNSLPLTFYNLNPTSKLLGSPSYAWIVLLARKTALPFLHHKTTASGCWYCNGRRMW